MENKEKVLSLEETNALIEAGNVAFAAMTRKQKRVALAKDVILQLKAEKVRALCGTYVELSNYQLEELKFQEADSCGYWKPTKKMDEPACETLFNQEGPVVQCSACALGSLVLSALRQGRDGDISAGRLKSGSFEVVQDVLGDYFDPDEQALIEASFETCDIHDYFQEDAEGEDLWEECERAIRFGDRFENDTERLIAIMQNIVDNDGTFCP